jgi:voltage-gated potassium channel
VTNPGGLPATKLTWVSVAGIVLRVAATSTLLVALYFVAPLDDDLDEAPVLLLALCLLGVLALIAWQARAIVRSPLPTARAIQALAASFPLFVVSFATAYYLMARDDPAAFAQPLTRLDALYFTLTVVSTVGFGDIAPATQLARGVVTAQMFLNLIVIGVGLRFIVGTVKLARERHASADG